MFASGITADPRSRQTTRRFFLAGSAAVAATAGWLALHRTPGVEASTDIHGTPGELDIVTFSNDGKNLGRQHVPKIVKTDGEWFTQLGKNSYNIARDADTEMPFSGVSLKEHRPGVFRCVCCQTALFSSRTKFDSGTGWPSFWAPIAHENVAELTDRSFGMSRTEVKCARCDAHLGHVFSDGPEPTGLRYCMNSASMTFTPA